MRKLACGCLCFSATVFLANYLITASWLPVLSAVLGGMGLCVALLRIKHLRGLVIALFAAALGLGCYFARETYTSGILEKVEGKTLEISAELLDYPAVYNEYCRAEVLLCGDGLPHVKAILYDNSAAIGDAIAGERIACTVSVKAADSRYGEEYDYYYAKGIYLILSSKSDIAVTDGAFSLRTVPQRMRHSIGEMCDSLFPSDTAAFIKSLTLGDKSDLYDDTGAYLALSRAGLMHTVAVSGMHIAFLIGFLQLILGVSKRSSLICIAIAWAFVAITGFSPSAVRAGFMQSVLLAAPLVRRENDPITSLSAVLAAILFVNPYAAASVSLQLSFAAMAGMILFSGKIYNAIAGCISSERLRRRFNYPITIMACSLSVMVFSVPLTALHFGYVSVLSPIGNILCLWAVSLCFCGAYAALVLGFIYLPLGIWAAWLVSWPARYILAAVKFISQVPFACVYLNNLPAKVWLAATYVFILIAVFSKLNVILKFIIPTVLSAAALTSTLISVSTLYASVGGVISVLDVGQGQCICAISGGSTVMVDCGGNGLDNAGETAGEYLLARGRTRVDALLLTHLHADHCNGVAMLAEMVDIGVIIIPEDADDVDEKLTELTQTALSHGIAIERISEDADFSCGGISFSAYVSKGTGNVNERGLMFLLSAADYDMLITGDSSKGAELELLEGRKLSDVELLVVGHHGSRYSSSGEFLQTIGAEDAIISVGYNTYGHPTYETLERLNAYGYTIYRTDLNGTVEFRISDRSQEAANG